MSRNAARPLSPHLTIWRWGPHMLVSILHRATGTALAIGGGVLFVGWLVTAASGAETYAKFIDCVTSDESGRLNWLPALVLIGLTWSVFQHMFSGIRHFVLDTGAGYDLRVNRIGALLTIAGSITVTAVIWACIFTRG